MKKSKKQQKAEAAQPTSEIQVAVADNNNATCNYKTKKLALTDALWGLLAGFVAAWFVGLFAIDYNAPLRPSGDYVFALFHVKSLLSFGTVLSNPDVAFPSGGNFASFPTPDILAHVIVKTFGLFSHNPLIVLISFTTFCFISVGLSTFLALRMSNIGVPLSFMSAVVYGASSHMVERAPLHPWLCLLIAIPWICRLCVFSSYQRPRLRQRPLSLSATGAAVVGIVTGISGLYWAFFGATFLVVALLILMLQGAQKRQGRGIIVALAAIVIAFTLSMLPNIIDYINNGSKLPQRNLFFQALYGIHLPDVFLPRIPIISHFYNAYATAQNSVSTEGNYNVLELWGLIGLVYGLIVCLKRLFPNMRSQGVAIVRRSPALHMATFLSMFGLLFAVPYGLGMIFNMLFSGAIRSQNRIGVFLLFFALMMAAILFEKAKQKMPPHKFWGMIAVILLLTIAPSFNAVAVDQSKSIALWKSRETSIKNVISELDKNNLLRVAQYPSLYFPESPSLPTFGNTEHFWLYVLDNNQARKWSFGSMPHETLWQKLILSWDKQIDEWFSDLRSMGYDSIVIEKRALVSSSAKRMEEIHSQKLSKLIIYEDAERLVIKIPKDF